MNCALQTNKQRRQLRRPSIAPLALAKVMKKLNFMGWMRDPFCLWSVRHSWFFFGKQSLSKDCGVFGIAVRWNVIAVFVPAWYKLWCYMLQPFTVVSNKGVFPQMKWNFLIDQLMLEAPFGLYCKQSVGGVTVLQQFPELPKNCNVAVPWPSL